MKKVFFVQKECVVDYISATGLVSITKKKYPEVQVPGVIALSKFLDKQKKGLVSFVTIMEYIKDYSEISKYPNVEDMRKDIAMKLLDKEGKSMKEYVEEIGVGVGENIPVRVFVEKIVTPFGIQKRDAYYLYDQLREGTQTRLNAATLINQIEEKRGDLMNEQNLALLPEDVYEDIKSEPENEVVTDTGDFSKPLADSVLELYNLIFAEDAKKRMSEVAVFRVFDTDANGYLSKAEFRNGLAKLKLKFTSEQINEIIEFADKDKNGNISMAEFMEMVKISRARITTQKANKVSAGLGKTPEELYNIAITKVKKYAEMCKENIINFDYKFQCYDDANEGVLTMDQFGTALRELRIGLSEEEIKLISHKADLNKDGVINYEEFINYLNELNIQELPKALANKQKKTMKSVIVPTEKVTPPTQKLLDNIKLLKEKTNFYKFDATPVPIDKVVGNIDTPYPDFEIIPEKHFTKFDSTTGKYKATILNSQKAAILWQFFSTKYPNSAEILFRRLKPNQKFEDPEFGPLREDKYGKFSLYPDGVPPDGVSAKPEDLEWHRPSEICEKPCFMDREGLNAGDVAQGELGNCWFVSALSSVAANSESLIMSNMDPTLLEALDTQETLTQESWGNLKGSLFSPIFHYYATKGMYVIRFMKDCRWRYVIIDDKLPCRRDKVPIYAKDKNLNEFWVSLVEKAYAKLHGNYYNLRSGFIHEALGDLTGAIPEKIDLDELKEDNDPDPTRIDEFWRDLMVLSGNAVMGCSVRGSTEGQIRFNGIPTGILSGHAYAILDVFQIHKSYGKGKSRLLRIRNPWGDTEWRGKWADNSEQLQENKDAIIKHYKEVRKVSRFPKYDIKLSNMEKWEENAADDGTFLICYKDWRELFTTMYVCRDFFRNDEYRATLFSYRWTAENNGGTPIKGTEEQKIRWGINPQVMISIREAKVELHISVAQEDPRMKEKGTFPYPGILHPFCLCILRCEGLQTSLPEQVQPVTQNQI
eukprot:TRINITY_DN8_c0_g1_i1.p3 TRINITY_DN8_c0_g1~~TRINITY_DN8_c0_g1_i1.p3  ORF type:complete len:989 (-),score=126.44 TRINITY_DN8_c0_g1_i1:6417-9383(-)